MSRKDSLLDPGSRIADRYLVVRVLGRGGMGEVFEVEHEAIGRHFALKVLGISPLSDDVLRRFRREARALGRVTSPRVAQVTDFGVDPQVGPFYVMEMLEGETLESRLSRDGRIPVDAAVALAIEMCEALAEVHGAGIIHRDFKPSNVGLTQAGPVRVKLLDFGLAAGLDESFIERITQSQEIIGTLPYMAPEQFRGAEPSPAIDLYSFGIVLFEMLCGRRPFGAPFPAALIQHHLFSPVPSFESLSPGLGVPHWLESVVGTLLAKEPAERFSSAAEASRALQFAGAGATRLGGISHLPTTRFVPDDTLPDPNGVANPLAASAPGSAPAGPVAGRTRQGLPATPGAPALSVPIELVDRVPAPSTSVPRSAGSIESALGHTVGSAASVPIPMHRLAGQPPSSAAGAAGLSGSPYATAPPSGPHQTGVIAGPYVAIPLSPPGAGASATAATATDVFDAAPEPSRSLFRWLAIAAAGASVVMLGYAAQRTLAAPRRARDATTATGSAIAGTPSSQAPGSAAGAAGPGRSGDGRAVTGAAPVENGVVVRPLPVAPADAGAAQRAPGVARSGEKGRDGQNGGREPSDGKHGAHASATRHDGAHAAAQKPSHDNGEKHPEKAKGKAWSGEVIDDPDHP